MDRIETRAEARKLLESMYLTEPEERGRDAGRSRLAELARSARGGGARLDEHREGPWRSDRCRFAHSGGRESRELTCVMRGEFELPFDGGEAGDVAALLNWAEVPEPGAQT